MGKTVVNKNRFFCVCYDWEYRFIENIQSMNEVSNCKTYKNESGGP